VEEPGVLIMTRQEKQLLVVMKSAQKKLIHGLHGRPSKQNQHGGVGKIVRIPIAGERQIRS
jgi:hypothetical protein